MTTTIGERRPEATTDPLILVLFGATGDLARRKLFPGLYKLFRAGLLPEKFTIVGSGRRSPGTDEEFRDQLAEAVRTFAGGVFEEDTWKRFAARITFQTSSADDGEQLAYVVRREHDAAGEQAKVLVFLSVPPATTEAMVRMLGKTGIADGASIIVEKPFGRDLKSARALNAALHEVVPEERLFRIDHFVGKEAVQNILALRFANGMFEPLWNRDHIAYMQIDVPERIDIEGRSAFMESTGTFRDMVSTHLFQILGFLTLEPPERMGSTELRAERHKLYESMRPLAPEDVVFGQYEGYREEDGVDPQSQVETFVALRAWVDNPRWQGVRFLLRTGKAMGDARRTVTIGFRTPPAALFGDQSSPGHATNELVLELTDEPVITLRTRVKRPGPGFEVADVPLRLHVGEAFPGEPPLEAYERLLLDAMHGDQTLFTGSAEIERLWEVSDPILANTPAVLPYPRGSWGPQAALDMPGELSWRLPDEE
jgi:glucose-6-phosphate 1-dehydrogenase